MKRARVYDGNNKKKKQGQKLTNIEFNKKGNITK